MQRHNIKNVQGKGRKIEAAAAKGATQLEIIILGYEVAVHNIINPA
jgi:hypothetical protein